MLRGEKGIIFVAIAITAIVFLVFSIPQADAATTYYVDDDNCPGPGTGTQADPFCKIQDAINSASDGDTINVAAGTYDEYISIQKPVNLIGAGSAVTTLTYSGTDKENIVMFGNNAVPTFSQGMTFSGFKLISTSLIDDKEYINLRASGASPADPIIIKNNLFDGVNEDNGMVGIETVSGGSTSNFTIENNTFINAFRYCMWFNSAINVVIRGNTMIDARYTALAMCTSDTNQIYDVDIRCNTILNSTSWSLAADYYPGYGPWYSAMHIGSTVYNITIFCNTIADGFYHGIYIHDRGNPDLSNVHINCNDIYNNPNGSINEVTSVTLDAENNWWGAVDGPGGSGPGSGDPVDAYFDVDPFLTAPRKQSNTCIANITDPKVAVDMNGAPLEPGDVICYTAWINNTGGQDSTDNLGNEFEDPIHVHTTYNPGSLTINGAGNDDDISDGIGYDAVNDTIIWNGVIPAFGSIEISFCVTIDLDVPGGADIENQGIVYFDSDGDGINDEPGQGTDDPGTEPVGDPTVLSLGGGPSGGAASTKQVPALTQLGLLCLAGVIVFLGVINIRKKYT